MKKSKWMILFGLLGILLASTGWTQQLETDGDELSSETIKQRRQLDIETQRIIYERLYGPNGFMKTHSVGQVEVLSNGMQRTVLPPDRFNVMVIHAQDMVTPSENESSQSDTRIKSALR